MKKVLFVCVENSCRSQIAEAFARMHGREIVEACSAGSRPSGKVHPAAVAAMGEIGYDLCTHTSKSLADFAGVEFDLAITMGCGDECPVTQAREFEDWNIPDPKNLPPSEFRAVRDQIESRVKALLTRLRNESK